MKKIFLLAFLFSAQVSAQCFSPAPADADCSFHPSIPVEPVGPSEMCLPEGCQPVIYTWLTTADGTGAAFSVAQSWLPNGYPVMGWSGACPEVDRSLCPNIRVQAWNDLYINALKSNRAQRAVAP